MTPRSAPTARAWARASLAWGGPIVYGRNLASKLLLEFNGASEGDEVEDVHFEEDAFALDGLLFVVELDAGKDGHLLDANGYFH